MQSSANTALVGLIVIVSALLLSAALLVLGGSGIDFFAGNKYFVLARFDDVTGIDKGMPVTANGRRVGVVDKIVERKSGRITSGPIDVKLRIDERVALRREARAVVTQPEFLGDQVLVLEGLAAPGEPAEIKEGDVIEGLNGGSLAQLVSAKVNETAEEMNQKLDLVMAQAIFTVQSVNALLGSMTEMIETNKVAVKGTLTNVQAASQNMVGLSASLAQASNSIAKLASDPQHQKTISELSTNLLATSKEVQSMAASMNALVSDQQVNDDMKATVAAMRQTTENLNKSLEAMGPTLGKVGPLLDESTSTIKAVGDVARGVSGFVGGGEEAASGAKSKVQSGIQGVTSNIHMRFDMDTLVLDSNDDLSYSGDDLRTRDINATLGYGEVFTQFGANNIGLDDSGMDFLVGKGNPNKGFSYKTGAYKSEVATGASYRTGKNAGVDAYMYDSNDPKYDAFIKVPVGRTFSAIVGMEDIAGESQVTVGAGVAY